jgi:hypothetical protein
VTARASEAVQAGGGGGADTAAILAARGESGVGIRPTLPGGYCGSKTSTCAADADDASMS